MAPFLEQPKNRQSSLSSLRQANQQIFPFFILPLPELLQLWKEVLYKYVDLHNCVIGLIAINRVEPSSLWFLSISSWKSVQSHGTWYHVFGQLLTLIHILAYNATMQWKSNYEGCLEMQAVSLTYFFVHDLELRSSAASRVFQINIWIH